MNFIITVSAAANEKDSCVLSGGGGVARVTQLLHKWFSIIKPTLWCAYEPLPYFFFTVSLAGIARLIVIPSAL